MAVYRVKGSTINSKFAFVRARFGHAAEQQLEEQLARGTGASRPFLDSAWYPFETYVQVLKLIARNHYQDDVSRLAAIGEGSADVTFAATYRAFMSGDDFLRFLKRMPKLHAQFYDQGRIEVEIVASERECYIRHRDKDTYDDADLHVAQGFYRRAAELHGLEVVYCVFSRCARGVDFKLRWL